MNKKKIKRIKQLEKICELYDCKIKCLSAVTFILDNNITDTEEINSFFDCSKTCSLSTIREFICETLPGINNCCVCQNLDEKIKSFVKESK